MQAGGGAVAMLCSLLHQLGGLPWASHQVPRAPKPGVRWQVGMCAHSCPRTRGSPLSRRACFSAFSRRLCCGEAALKGARMPEPGPVCPSWRTSRCASSACSSTCSSASSSCSSASSSPSLCSPAASPEPAVYGSCCGSVRAPTRVVSRARRQRLALQRCTACGSRAVSAQCTWHTRRAGCCWGQLGRWRSAQCAAQRGWGRRTPGTSPRPLRVSGGVWGRERGAAPERDACATCCPAAQGAEPT